MLLAADEAAGALALTTEAIVDDSALGEVEATLSESALYEAVRRTAIKKKIKGRKDRMEVSFTTGEAARDFPIVLPQPGLDEDKGALR